MRNTADELWWPAGTEMKHYGADRVDWIRRTSEPTREMAEIALVADIRRVEQRSETLVMTRYPTNPARKKTYELDDGRSGHAVPIGGGSRRRSVNTTMRGDLVREN